LPLSSGQQRLWFLDQFDPESTAYNIVGGTRFTGSLDRQSLARSLAEIVGRHESLRTNIVNVDGSPLATLRSASEWKMDVRSLRDLPTQDREHELSTIARNESTRRFDLASDLLIRACLVEVAENDHVLLMAIHHIAADGWSLSVFASELVQLYEAFSSGRPSPLPDLPIQFSDFAAWHRHYVERGLAQAQVSFWKQQLSGPLAITELPTDRPRPGKITYAGLRSRQQLPEQLWQSVEQFSLTRSVTPFVTLLTAFKVLLLRYTRQPDVIVGTAAAGRSRPELEKLMGLFMNNLVLRTDVSGNPTAEELVVRVQETALGAFSHEHVPLDSLAQILQPNRNLSRTPFFQIMFLFQNFPMRAAEIAGLRIEPFELDPHTSRFDLSVEVRERDGGLALDWEFNTDLFDTSTVERFQTHYRSLLEALLHNPKRRISELPMFTAAERLELTEAAGQTAAEYPRDLCAHEIVERQAITAPETVAILCGNDRLTYRELSLRSNRMACRLQAMGVSPGALVALCVERSVEMIVALLAIWKAGAAYVPLDPQYPKDRLAFMLADSGAQALITESHLIDALPADLPAALFVDRDPALGIGVSEALPVRSSGPEDLAYVIYTSGSTGKPKGVCVTHRALVNFLSSMRREPGISSSDRLLAVTTLSFDIAGLELYLPLVSGAQVILASRAAATDGAALAQLLLTHGITIMQATPATWRLLLESGWRGTPGLKVLCGGEALPRDLANRLLNCGAELWNLYGPTETTIWSTIHHVASQTGPVLIGRPIGNTRLYILDEDRELTPPGVAGELYIGGDGLAREYLRRPELTAQRFVEAPFRPGERLYRTGDLVRRLPDGNLEFLGRLDHQVKMRGFRIELGEIEAALERLPGIRQAVVIRDETERGPRLVAYVVQISGTVTEPATLRRLLLAELPDYMVPSIFVSLDAMPLTPNRKVNRAALPSPDTTASVSALYVPPETETERELAAIWQDLLAHPRVGLHDNFFDLGGHSLLVIQLQSRLRRRFQRELSVVELFEHPTVSATAALLGREDDKVGLARGELVASAGRG
jgi:amino acid adenylation domain-containing protein